MFMCPVCGYPNLEDDPKLQNYDICPCCATEFGASDVSNTYEELRADWIARGKQWWSDFEFDPVPEGWNADEQLKNVVPQTP